MNLYYIEKSFIAIQSKTESSLFIWDINKRQDPNQNRLASGQDLDIIANSNAAGVLERKRTKEIISDPLSMFGKVHDDIYSLSWFPES